MSAGDKQGSTENTRAGKYCPRCHTMTRLAQETCAQCGHEFRTGREGQASGAPRTDTHTLHRTQQFTLPPLPPRSMPLRQAPMTEQTPPPSRRLGLLVATAVLLLAALAAAWYLWQSGPARRAKISPVGIWETTLASRSSENARLEFAFRDDGSGQFAWATGHSPVHQGQTPLHWRLDTAGRLVLTLPPPTKTDAVSGTLITIFGSHPWLWRVNPGRHQLTLGTLIFQQK